MNILGLNAFHGDSAACLVRDGQLVAAAEEERFRRVKHWAGLPTEAIKYCLEEGGLRFGELDHIAINRKPGVNNWRRLLFVLRHRPAVGLIQNKISNIRAAQSIETRLRTAFAPETLRAQIHPVEHHLAHLASAFLVSDFKDAVCVSVDGFGDFASAAWGLGQNNEIQVDGRIYFPHSLGIFYTAITQFLGFPYFGDEYKVMGLSPYGEPHYLEQMRKIVLTQPDGTYKLALQYFLHHTHNVSYSWNDCAPEVGTLYAPALESLLGPARKSGDPLEQRHKDLARSAQAMYEEAFFALLSALYRKYECPNLALAGGCAMNSVANGKVYLQSPFKKMYLPAAAGDAGGAIGAAFVVWHEEKAESRKQKAEIRDGRRDDGQPDHGPHSSLPSPGGEGQGEGVLSPLHAHEEKAESRKQKAEIENIEEKGESRKQSPLSSPHSALRTPNSELRTPNSPLRTSNNGHFVMSHAYTGPQFDDAEIAALLASRGLLAAGEKGAPLPNPLPRAERGAPAAPRSPVVPSSEFTVTCHTDPTTLYRATAQAIAAGKVIGWFQGRMEWGPRALGNRSILCDPRRADMKEILNAKIKRRESFRPFAPSILREHVNEWFEQDDDVPFMMQVFQVRKEKRSLVPATTHVDGSGRLQTVHRDTNPHYWGLISEFCSLTKVPMVLNTSFNENEPVVCKPEEALDCFLRTKMDVIVLEKFLVQRRAEHEEIGDRS